jgi:hypothetical protein
MPTGKVAGLELADRRRSWQEDIVARVCPTRLYTAGFVEELLGKWQVVVKERFQNRNTLTLLLMKAAYSQTYPLGNCRNERAILAELYSGRRYSP